MNSKNVQHEAIGLANRRYAAVTYTNTKHSLFDLVAQVLGVEGDVNSRSTVISLRDYRLRYPRNGGKGAAREGNVTFNLEVPKGVTFTLDASYIDPGPAYSDVIQDRAWSFGVAVTLSL